MTYVMAVTRTNCFNHFLFVVRLSVLFMNMFTIITTFGGTNLRIIHECWYSALNWPFSHSVIPDSSAVTDYSVAYFFIFCSVLLCCRRFHHHTKNADPNTRQRSAPLFCARAQGTVRQCVVLMPLS